MTRHKTDCPRCGSQEVRQRAKGFFRDLDQGIRMNIGGGWGLKFAVKRTYICIACGHIEEFVEDEQALRYIAEHWPPAEG